MKLDLKVEFKNPRNHVPYFVPRLLKSNAIDNICNKILSYNQKKAHRLYDICFTGKISHSNLMLKTIISSVLKELNNINKWLYFIANCSIKNFKIDEELNADTFEEFIKKLDKLTLHHLGKFKSQRLIHLLERIYYKEKM